MLRRHDTAVHPPRVCLTDEAQRSSRSLVYFLGIDQHGAEMTAKRSFDLDLRADHLTRTSPEAIGVFVRQR